MTPDEAHWREQALIACAELCHWNPYAGQCHSTQAQHAADAVLRLVIRPLMRRVENE